MEVNGLFEIIVALVIIGIPLGIAIKSITSALGKKKNPTIEDGEYSSNKINLLKPSYTANKIIFLSYRREDSADVSGRIYDHLSEQYSNKNIFKDVDSIPLGVDFQKYIDTMISKSNIFLVIIGPDWLGRSTNNRRIDNSKDFVRMEVKSALRLNIPVIPLLVRNAKMPNKDELPKDIQDLALRNGIPIRPDPDFNNDMKRLISGIKKIQ